MLEIVLFFLTKKHDKHFIEAEKSEVTESSSQMSFFLKLLSAATAFNSSVKPGGSIFISQIPFFSPSSVLLYFFCLSALSNSLSPSHSRSASVKYIKEMSAFFKNSGSPGAALPWDSPPSTPQRGTELSPAEVKEPRSIPLKMCQVSRKQCPPDTENR